MNTWKSTMVKKNTVRAYAYDDLLVVYCKLTADRPKGLDLFLDDIVVPKPVLGIALTDHSQCLLVGYVEGLSTIQKAIRLTISDTSGRKLVSSAKKEIRPLTARSLRSLSIQDQTRIWKGLLYKTRRAFPRICEGVIEKIAIYLAIKDVFAVRLTDDRVYFRCRWLRTEQSQEVCADIRIARSSVNETFKGKVLVDNDWIHGVLPLNGDYRSAIYTLIMNNNQAIPFKFTRINKGNQDASAEDLILRDYEGDRDALSNYIQDPSVSAMGLLHPSDRLSRLPTFKYGGIESAIILDKGHLLIVGWLFDQNEDIEAVRFCPSNDDLLPKFTSYSHPNVKYYLSHQNVTAEDANQYGFISIVCLETNWRDSAPLYLEILPQSGSKASLTINRLERDLEPLKDLILQSPDFCLALVEALAGGGLQVPISIGQGQLITIREYLRKADKVLALDADPSIGDLIHLVVDTVLEVEPLGLFLTGWKLDPSRQINTISLHSENGLYIDLLSSLIGTPRPDIYDAFAKKGISLVNDNLGFVCLARTDLLRNQQCLYLKVTLNDRRVHRIPFVVKKPSFSRPLPTIKTILSVLRYPTSCTQPLLDNAIGPVVKRIWERRSRFRPKPKVTIHGQLPSQPTVSVVVPLYGRYDFVQHQLSLFADDPDFQKNELIYVMDDPIHYEEFRHFCADIAPLFNVPFKTVYAGENMGFSGASNLGVSQANGKYVLLLNSDVMPKESGWLEKMRAVYESLPNAGALGPKLLYADESIQHAGIQFKTFPSWGGLWVNDHPRKGQPNRSEHDLMEIPVSAVTAACLMVRRDKYSEVEGLCEDYIRGDFEDSDFCLKLLRKDYQNWYTPKIELYHMERQSQSTPNEQNLSTSLTMYNCWLHTKRNGTFIEKLQSKTVQ